MDVSEGDAGVVELKEIIPTMEGKVALSARAQVAMWKILKGEADSIDRLMAKTADIGGPEGEAIRLELELAKEEVIGRAAILAGANEAAAAAGVPPATVDEWLSPAEASRTAGAAAAGAGAVLSSPAFWGIVIVGVLVVAIVIYSDYMKATKTAEFRMLEKEKEIDALKQAGASPDQLAAAIIVRGQLGHVVVHPGAQGTPRASVPLDDAVGRRAVRIREPAPDVERIAVAVVPDCEGEDMAVRPPVPQGSPAAAVPLRDEKEPPIVPRGI